MSFNQQIRPFLQPIHNLKVRIKKAPDTYTTVSKNKGR